MEGYPSDPTLRDFSKAVECARVVLKADLAPFEIGEVIYKNFLGWSFKRRLLVHIQQLTAVNFIILSAC